MHRILLLLLPCLLLSAGCLTASEPPAEAGIVLVAPADPVALFDGTGTLSNLVGRENPGIKTNYSVAYCIIPPGNGTPPHRLFESTELVYVISGTAEIRCDNATVTAGAGEAVLLPERVLQSITSTGDTDLRYLTVVQPPFHPDIEFSGDELATLSMTTDARPVVVAGPREGIEWDLESGVAAYTLINPVLMREKALPIDYSLAYVELLPGGYLGHDGIKGSSDLLYVIEGEIEVNTPGGQAVRVPAGSAACIPPDLVKETRNVAPSTTKILSFIDPAWMPEKTGLFE